MRLKAEVLAALAAAVLATASHGVAIQEAAESGCVTCHTDAEKIRSLYTPPKIEFEFDEGEG